MAAPRTPQQIYGSMKFLVFVLKNGKSIQHLASAGALPGPGNVHGRVNPVGIVAAFAVHEKNQFGATATAPAIVVVVKQSLFPGTFSAKYTCTLVDFIL